MERNNGIEADEEGAFVYYDDHQAAIDAVLQEAVWMAEHLNRMVEDLVFLQGDTDAAIERKCARDGRYRVAKAFLARPDVQAWRARQNEQG